MREGDLIRTIGHGNGKRVTFRMLHVFEFAQNGAIRRENVWLDLGSIQQQLPQA